MLLKLENVEKHYKQFDLKCSHGSTAGICHRIDRPEWIGEKYHF